MTKGTTPDRALAVALSALADAKIELFDNYEITITRRDDEPWGVWFVALPKTPGMDYFVTIASDGRIGILPGL